MTIDANLLAGLKFGFGLGVLAGYFCGILTAYVYRSKS